MSNPKRAATYATSNVPGGETVIINDSMFNNVTGNQQIYNGPREALQFLKQNVSSAAFHNSKERFDPPKCHENTRTAVLKKIMDWIMSCDPDTRDRLIMWIRGAAGAGKSAIAQTLAELCEQRSLILASYFFSRFDPTRNHPRALIATIAYQIYVNIPAIRDHILCAIDSDPLIFERNLVTQLDTLIHQPLQELMQAGTPPLPRRLIIIDGLDECSDDEAQREVIEALFHAVNRLHTPILFLVASRPQLNITVAFDADISNVLGRIPLDDDYRSYKDIEQFLRDRFRRIKETHRLKRFLPETWPNNETVYILVSKSSGQFIYASTVIKYVESPRRRPDLQLEIIQGLRPPQNDKDMPFAELDELYAHILSAIGPLEDITLVLEILRFVINIRTSIEWDICDLEHLFGLEAGSIETLFCDLGGLVDFVDAGEVRPRLHDVQPVRSYVVNASAGNGQIIKILHASFQDFLDDSSRSKEYYCNPTQVVLEQLKRCFRFIVKCSSATSDTISSSTLLLAASFFVKMHKNVQCDIELANILDDRSILRWMRLLTLAKNTRKYYLISFLPKLFHFLKRSDKIEAYLKLQMALDDEYLSIVIEPYYRDTLLSFLLAFLCLKERIPRREFMMCVCNASINLSHDELFLVRGGRSAFPIINHIDIILQYLRSTGHSRQYSMKTAGGRLYSNALLHCLHLVHDTELYSHYLTDPFENYSQKYSRSYDQRDSKILSQLTQNHEDSQGSATDLSALHPSSYLENLQTLSEDDSTIPDGPSLDVWNVNLYESTGDFYVRHLLGKALYFFPRAGRCDQLLHFCKIKYVPKNSLSLQDRETVFRAMDAYVDRWKDGGSGSPEVDEWAYPFPLVERKVSIFTDGEKEAILKLRAQSGT